MALLYALPPQARSLMQLLARLVRDEDVALLAADIKADAAPECANAAISEQRRRYAGQGAGVHRAGGDGVGSRCALPLDLADVDTSVPPPPGRARPCRP